MSYRLVEPPFEDVELPVVSTTYDLNTANQHIAGGGSIVIRPITENPELWDESYLFQNFDDGRIEEASGRKVLAQYGRLITYPESEWEEVAKIRTYMGRMIGPGFGVYLLPGALKAGSRVYIPELIEHVVATKFWDSPFAADDGFAVWDGADLILDLAEYERIELIG